MYPIWNRVFPGNNPIQAAGFIIDAVRRISLASKKSLLAALDAESVILDGGDQAVTIVVRRENAVIHAAGLMNRIQGLGSHDFE